MFEQLASGKIVRRAPLVVFRPASPPVSSTVDHVAVTATKKLVVKKKRSRSPDNSHSTMVATGIINSVTPNVSSSIPIPGSLLQTFLARQRVSTYSSNEYLLAQSKRSETHQSQYSMSAQMPALEWMNKELEYLRIVWKSKRKEAQAPITAPLTNKLIKILRDILFLSPGNYNAGLQREAEKIEQELQESSGDESETLVTHLLSNILTIKALCNTITQEDISKVQPSVHLRKNISLKVLVNGKFGFFPAQFVNAVYVRGAEVCDPEKECTEFIMFPFLDDKENTVFVTMESGLALYFFPALRKPYLDSSLHP